MQIQKEFFKYSLPSLLIEYNKNRELINAHFKGESVEGYTLSPTKILGLTIELFMFLIIMHLVLFVWALVVLAKRWKQLDTGIQIVSVICLLAIPMGSLITLILVYAST
jgi:hypothetical protein